jgi:hypothetical protein
VEFKNDTDPAEDEVTENVPLYPAGATPLIVTAVPIGYTTLVEKVTVAVVPLPEVDVVVTVSPGTVVARVLPCWIGIPVVGDIVLYPDN